MLYGGKNGKKQELSCMMNLIPVCGKCLNTIQIKNIEHLIASWAVEGTEQRKVCGPGCTRQMIG